MIKTLLVTNNGNTKIKKSAEGSGYKIASLSMAPDDLICQNRKIAECDLDCLFKSGRGAMKVVERSRRAKTRLWHTDRDLFLKILRKDIEAHIRSSKKADLIPAVRLNTISDIPWEDYGIFQDYPELIGYDYTKIADRLGKTPPNYSLMFSFSQALGYRAEVDKVIETDFPISVVFRGGFPARFLGREVIDGDRSDLFNLEARGKVIGLKLKGGKAIQSSDSPFIVDNPDLVEVAA